MLFIKGSISGYLKGLPYDPLSATLADRCYAARNFEKCIIENAVVTGVYDRSKFTENILTSASIPGTDLYFTAEFSKKYPPAKEDVYDVIISEVQIKKQGITPDGMAYFSFKGLVHGTLPADDKEKGKIVQLGNTGQIKTGTRQGLTNSDSAGNIPSNPSSSRNPSTSGQSSSPSSPSGESQPPNSTGGNNNRRRGCLPTGCSIPWWLLLILLALLLWWLLQQPSCNCNLPHPVPVPPLPSDTLSPVPPDTSRSLPEDTMQIGYPAIRISINDWDMVDKDKINGYINNELLFHDLELSAAPAVFSFENLHPGINIFRIEVTESAKGYATPFIQINDGKNVQQYKFALVNNQSKIIRIFYSPKKN